MGSSASAGANRADAAADAAQPQIGPGALKATNVLSNVTRSKAAVAVTTLTPPCTKGVCTPFTSAAVQDNIKGISVSTSMGSGSALAAGTTAVARNATNVLPISTVGFCRNSGRSSPWLASRTVQSTTRGRLHGTSSTSAGANRAAANRARCIKSYKRAIKRYRNYLRNTKKQIAKM